MTMTMFKQCQLYRPRVEGSGDFYTTWIPEEFAKVGKILELKDIHGGSWSPGWRVDAVYSRMPEEYVRGHERDCLTQRDASDIPTGPKHKRKSVVRK